MSGAINNPIVGFCILSHNNPAQLLDLIETLNRVYSVPPIVCHHDSSQSKIDYEQFPKNVIFVKPPIKTRWGRISVVLAASWAIDELFKMSNAEWFVLLSASDFPVRPADDLYTIIRKAECDAFIDARPLFIQNESVAITHGKVKQSLDHFSSPDNIRSKTGWYLNPQFWLPTLKLSPKLRLGRITFRLPWTKKSIISSKINIFYGDHWFMANKKVANLIAHDSKNRRFLLRHLARRPLAEECFYHTLLMNDPELKICLDNYRFSEWRGGGAHPQTITLNDLPAIMKSGDLFARKFAQGSDVIIKIRKDVLRI